MTNNTSSDTNSETAIRMGTANNSDVASVSDNSETHQIKTQNP
jgi:hypothetical protein